MATNRERLESILGFDPSRNTSAAGVFKEALADVIKEREEQSKGKAIALLKQAIDLRQKMDENHRRYEVESKRFDKELGKLIGRIESLSGGKSPAQIEADEREQEEADS